MLVKHKLLKFWDEGTSISLVYIMGKPFSSAIGWLWGFVDKQKATDMVALCRDPTFLIRFSDSQLGAISIAFICRDEQGGTLTSGLISGNIGKLESYV